MIFDDGHIFSEVIIALLLLRIFFLRKRPDKLRQEGSERAKSAWEDLARTLEEQGQREENDGHRHVANRLFEESVVIREGIDLIHGEQEKEN